MSDKASFVLGHTLLGHSGSTYWRKKESEKAEIFRKIEPYLTFLQPADLGMFACFVCLWLELFIQSVMAVVIAIVVTVVATVVMSIVAIMVVTVVIIIVPVAITISNINITVMAVVIAIVVTVVATVVIIAYNSDDANNNAIIEITQ